MKYLVQCILNIYLYISYNFPSVEEYLCGKYNFLINYFYNKHINFFLAVFEYSVFIIFVINKIFNILLLKEH